MVLGQPRGDFFPLTHQEGDILDDLIGYGNIGSIEDNPFVRTPGGRWDIWSLQIHHVHCLPVVTEMNGTADSKTVVLMEG